MSDDDWVFTSKQHTLIEAASASATLTLPPPPPMPGISVSGMGLPPDPTVEDFHSTAARRGYRFYAPELSKLTEVPKKKSELIMSVVSMIFVFIIMAGIPFYSYAKVSMMGKSIETPIVNSHFMYTINYMPDNWKMLKNPGKVARDSSAAGFFYKGSLANPKVQAIIYSQFSDNIDPDLISYQMYGMMEEDLILMNEMYMRSMGMEYEYLDSKLYDINNQPGLWMEGNGKCKKCKNLRDFTFIVFCPGRYYLIKFLFEEQDLNELWPEIRSILDSVEFH